MKNACLKFIASMSLVISFFYMTNEAVSAVHFVTKTDIIQSSEDKKPCPVLGYKKTVQSCTAEGKLLASLCPDNANYGKSCYCAATYKYDSTTCKDNKTPSGKSCDGKFDACTCDATKYKYTASNCPTNQTPSGKSCTESGVAKFEACSCSTATYKTCSYPLVGSGTTCEDASGTKNSTCSCSPEFNSTCVANGVKTGSQSCTEPSGLIKYKSADCNVPLEETTSCPYEYRHYWNADGAYTIPTSDTYVNAYGRNVTRAGGACAFEGYGHTSTITIPAGKTYNTAVLRFWGTNNVINGEFKTNDWMRFEGWSAKSSKFNWTFNDKATIDGRIVIDENKIGTVNFKKGLYGNHYCEYATDTTGKWNWVVSKTGRCPDSWYANTVDPDPCPYDYRHYWNSNGTYTIPTSDTYKNAYGNYVTRAGGACAFEGYGNSATVNIPAGKSYVNVIFRFWGTTTVNGALDVTRYIRFENTYNSTKYNYTFNDKVTVNGRIAIDTKMGSITFKKGLYGNHYCEWVEDPNGNWNFKILKSGPCPASWYTYGGGK